MKSRVRESTILTLPLKSAIVTRIQADRFRFKLQNLQNKLYQKIDWVKLVEETFDEQQKNALLDTLKLNDIDMHSIGDVETVVKVMIRELEDCRVLTLMVTQGLTAQALHRIAKWCAEQFKFKVLIEWRYDMEMLGGVKILFNGEIRDYSWDSVLDDIGRYKEMKVSTPKEELHE